MNANKKILKNPSLEKFMNFFDILDIKKNRKSFNQS